jgi:hypothetical protein
MFNVENLFKKGVTRYIRAILVDTTQHFRKTVYDKGVLCVYCCTVDGYCCCAVDRHYFPFRSIAVRTVCKSQAYFIVLSSPFCNSYYLFTLSFLSKQTRHGWNIVSFYLFLFICGRAKCLPREPCGGSNATIDALCSSCSLQKYLERWLAALYEAGRSVLMLIKGSKIPRIELNTVHL